MSQKDAVEREAFGPRPVKRKQNTYETKWRTNRALYEKVQAAALVEKNKAQQESGTDVEISVNAQLNFIVEGFIKTYEEKFGPLPDPKDETALRRYARAAANK